GLPRAQAARGRDGTRLRGAGPRGPRGSALGASWARCPREPLDDMVSAVSGGDAVHGTALPEDEGPGVSTPGGEPGRGSAEGGRGVRPRPPADLSGAGRPRPPGR